MTGTPIDRFMAKVSPEPMSGCWLWTGASSNGYGKFAIGPGQNLYAHRASLMLLRGVDLAKVGALAVDHKCFTPACVNPDHLELVTQRENVRRAAHIRRPWLYGETPTCTHGHELAGDNLRSVARGQRCRICFESMRRRRVARFIERHGQERVRGYRQAYIDRKKVG